MHRGRNPCGSYHRRQVAPARVIRAHPFENGMSASSMVDSGKMGVLIVISFNIPL